MTAIQLTLALVCTSFSVIIKYTLQLRCEWLVGYCTELLKCLICFPTWNIVTCIFCMDFAMAMHVLLLKITKGVFPTEGFRFPTEGFRLEVYLREFTRHCMILVLFRVFLCSLKGRWYERLTHERTFFRWFREVRVCPLVEWRMASRIGVSHMQAWRTLHEEDLYPYHDQRVQHLEPGDHAQRMDFFH